MTPVTNEAIARRYPGGPGWTFRPFPEEVFDEPPPRVATPPRSAVVPAASSHPFLRRHRTKFVVAMVLAAIWCVATIGAVGSDEASGSASEKLILAIISVTLVGTLAAAVFGPGMQDGSRQRIGDQEWAVAQQQADAAQERATAAWVQRREAHRQRQVERRERHASFVGVARAEPRTRLDVVGGTPFGWASLLNTLLRPHLAAGGAATILDLTDRSVAFDLARWSSEHLVGMPIGELVLPDDLGEVDVFGAMSDQQLGSAFATALHRLPGVPPGNDDDHARDAGLLAAVAGVIRGGGITVARMLDVLGSVRGVGITSSLLDADEQRALDDDPVLLANARWIEDRLPLYQQRLGQLRPRHTPQGEAERPADGRGFPVLADDGLLILATDSIDRTEERFLGTFLAACVHQQLTDLSVSGRRRPVLVVAGAERLSGDLIHELTARAARSGIAVPVVLLFAHAGAEVRQVVGRDGAETLFMRLDNQEDTGFASGLIGNQVGFVLSSLSTSLADSEGDSEGQNVGWSKGESVAEGSTANYGWGNGGGSNSRTVTQNYGTCGGTTWGTNWQRTATETETYELREEPTVRPTELQELPPTAFIYRPAGSRQPVFGDCNPEIAFRHDAVPALGSGAPEEKMPTTTRSGDEVRARARPGLRAPRPPASGTPGWP